MRSSPGRGGRCTHPSSASSSSVAAIPGERYRRDTLQPLRKEEREMTDVIDAPAAVKPINHWIGGKAYAGHSGRTGPVYNPATGEQSGAVDFASEDDVDRAVQAAKAAFPAWRALSL